MRNREREREIKRRGAGGGRGKKSERERKREKGETISFEDRNNFEDKERKQGRVTSRSCPTYRRK